MVKIKVKKEFTKREFIKYLLEQDDIEVDLENYHIEYHEGIRTDVIKPEISGKFPISFNHDTKMIELYVEEEVTEETKIPLLLEIKKLPNGILLSYTSHSENIEESKESDSLTFHMINPDGTTTLLWKKERGMVE